MHRLTAMGAPRQIMSVHSNEYHSLYLDLAFVYMMTEHRLDSIIGQRSRKGILSASSWL